jgi:hypothetical protein
MCEGAVVGGRWGDMARDIRGASSWRPVLHRGELSWAGQSRRRSALDRRC